MRTSADHRDAPHRTSPPAPDRTVPASDRTAPAPGRTACGRTAGMEVAA